MPMASKSRLSPFVFFFIFLALATTLAIAKEDPELQQCREKCQYQRGFDQQQKERCVSQCEDYSRHKHGGSSHDDLLWGKQKSPAEKLSECRQTCERKTDQQRHDCRDQCWEDYKRQEKKHAGGSSDAEEFNVIHPTREPEKRYKECIEQCKSKEGRDIELCHIRCDKQRRKEAGSKHENPTHRGEEEEEEGEGKERERNPYVFEDQHFQTKFETEHGRVRLLQNFAERSKLLVGLVNHRVSILEANPSTFIAPYHTDADGLFFVAEGKATISLVREDKRESFNLKRGDIIRIPSGTTVYMINRARNQKLVVVKLYQPVSTPGHYESFTGPGGKDPESFFNVFSPELLESAFNVKREKIQRLFEKQNQGVIVKASEQQIKAMSQHESGGGIWPFGGESKGPFNLFEKAYASQSKSNQYGQLFEVAADDNKDLRELNVGVSFANITKGSMTAPFYNSKATKIVLVIRGEGYFEMACPHLSKSGQQQQQQQHYERVKGQLRKGVLYVVPAGHPVITVSHGSQNLELLCLDVNGLQNEKYTLAGRRNIIRQLEKTALELSFGGVQEKEIREVFESQSEEFFFKGPSQSQQMQQEDGFAAE
ncbi:vicilin Jug r 6.0101-like [Impatiens glandulifera]|uniref:vicilin Jug r 6.0101-like n=1 Tax=Impatiens glandulifera TaxID=253017 RepID=UPI001FB18271|nr:vicilin Jug r 6.0101-like [Impatiens glandulifera]